MKRTFRPQQIRSVLRYLRDHPWSSASQIAKAVGMEPASAVTLIKNELKLRSRRASNPDGVQTISVFALPEVKRGD